MASITAARRAHVAVQGSATVPKMAKALLVRGNSFTDLGLLPMLQNQGSRILRPAPFFQAHRLTARFLSLFQDILYVDERNQRFFDHGCHD